MLSAETQLKNIMTTTVTAAMPEDSILDVARVMTGKDFDGIPVIDREQRLLGIITKKELLNSQGLYLPTIVQILESLKITHGQDIPELHDKLKTIKKLNARSIMNPNARFLTASTTVEKAAEAFQAWHQNPLPVLDAEKKLVGIVSAYDLLKSFGEITPATAEPALTMISELPDMLGELESKFVLVSQGRAHMWYMAILVFFLVGLAVATLMIIRIGIG